MQSGLPVGVAAFVGRERERAKVAALLAGGRVVTLTGSGGCGKTRLAVEVAGDVASRFGDGVHWVDLQAVRDPGLVARVVGEAVDVQARPGHGLSETLVEQLRSRHLLVVLDNCEHLVEACAGLVVELTSACPELHVLATSRMPLVVAGEATFEVAGLPVPDPDSSSPSTVGATAASRLFEVRARQVAADFRIDEGNAAAVAEICRRLDGIPLAIELAAARVSVLAPAQIAAGLTDRFALLTGGVRGAPARQRTLEASLDWSYELLDDAQRLALARLSVFAGSLDLDAARAVLAGGGIDHDDVLDLVGGLVKQSLVQVTRRQGTVRYRLLDTIHAYARQRLSELDDPARIRDRHLAFYAGFANRAQEGLHGPRPELWVARLADDLEDLLAAVDWAAEAGDLRGLVGVTRPIVRFWLERGLSREVHRRLHDAARVAEAGDDRVQGLNTAAALALATYEPASIHRSATEAVDAARGVDGEDPLALALAHRALSGVLSGQSTMEQVTADGEEAMDVARRCEHPSTHAHVLQFVGAARLHSQSIDEGYELFRQCVELCEAHDLAFHLPAAHGGSQAWLPWSGRLDESREHARRAIESSRQLGRPGWEAVGLTGLAACSLLEGDLAGAGSRLSEAQTALRPQGLEGTHYGMWWRHWRSLFDYVSDDLHAARDTAEGIIRVARDGGSRLDEAIGEWLLGLVAQADGHGDAAAEHFEASRVLSTEPRLPHTLGRSSLGLAQLAQHGEDLDRAWELAHESLQVLDSYDDRVGVAAALEMIADLAVALSEPDRALRLLAASHSFHAGSGLVRFPRQASRFDHARDAAEAELDGAEATACWDEGNALSLSEAVSYARRGRGERQRPRVGWASLTPAERDVVGLVAEGHTNAEIGDQLFISVNTVKKHLSNVYAKVDVEGRADLAAQVARREP